MQVSEPVAVRSEALADHQPRQQRSSLQPWSRPHGPPACLTKAHGCTWKAQKAAEGSPSSSACSLHPPLRWGHGHARQRRQQARCGLRAKFMSSCMQDVRCLQYWHRPGTDPLTSASLAEAHWHRNADKRRQAVYCSGCCYLRRTILKQLVQLLHGFQAQKCCGHTLSHEARDHVSSLRAPSRAINCLCFYSRHIRGIREARMQSESPSSEHHDCGTP